MVQYMGRRHHPLAHSMGACAILVRGDFGMTAANPLSTRLTPAYLYPVSLHIGLGHRGNVGHIGEAHSLIFESAPTSRATVPGYRHLNDRFRQVIGRGGLSVAERSPARLSARTFGLCGSCALGERSGLTLSRSLSLDESLLQLPDRRQLSSVPVLQSVDLDKKVAMLAGWEVFA